MSPKVLKVLYKVFYKVFYLLRVRLKISKKQKNKGVRAKPLSHFIKSKDKFKTVSKGILG